MESFHSRLRFEIPEGISGTPERMLFIDKLSIIKVALPSLTHLFKRGLFIVSSGREEVTIDHSVDEPWEVLLGLLFLSKVTPVKTREREEKWRKTKKNRVISYLKNWGSKERLDRKEKKGKKCENKKRKGKLTTSETNQANLLPWNLISLQIPDWINQSA